MRTMAHVLTAAGIVVGLAAPAVSAEYMEKNQQMASRSYSPGVISDGGRIVWLADRPGFRDEQARRSWASRRRRGRPSVPSMPCSRRPAAALPIW